jgi:hypothetical protein
MTDDFMRSLQHDWQSQDDGAARVLRRLRRNRWTPHVVLAFEILGCIGALLVGLWFAWTAVHSEDQQLLLALSAGVLLIAAPALCVASVRARRAALAWDSATPDALLRIGIRRAEASLRAVRIGRWHLAILAVFVAMLWVAEALHLIDAVGFLTLYSAVSLAASLLAWLWMSWREKRVRNERAACVRLLAIMQAGDDDSAL